MARATAMSRIVKTATRVGDSGLPLKLVQPLAVRRSCCTTLIEVVGQAFDRFGIHSNHYLDMHHSFAKTAKR